MATIVLASLIGLAVILSIRYTIQKKGSCDDCHVECPIKHQIEVRRSEDK